MLSFDVDSNDAETAARTATLTLRNGTVQTPVFAPVATKGAIKGILPDRLRRCGSQMLLANTYHLQLTPGATTVSELGELHEMMAWDRPILTDSGGYQVFSLSELREVTDQGVTFKNPRDGSMMFLGPREAIEIQQTLGSDVAMVLDECPPCPAEREEVKSAVERTLHWARICRENHCREDQAIFGIVQGGIYDDLRERCAKALAEMDFDGYAIGGVSVGEDDQLRYRAVRMSAPLLPADSPRYLMGVGFPPDVLQAIGEGIDMFDCVAPTRMGRNGTAFTATGRLRIRNSQHKTSTAPVEKGCECLACRLYSRGSIHHFFRSKEMLGPMLLTLHNLHFYHSMMQGAREAINKSSFAEFQRQFICRYNQEKKI
ncbi:MAG: tRNA guanosine(34) transglycosylase Tgt, partial [Candidatus Brocadiia bacterium]